MKPKISLIISGNLYMRQMRFNKGDVEKGHSHVYDHITLLSTGSLEGTVDGKKTIFKAPTAIKILAHKIHEFVALEDNTLAYCVHALRDASTEDVLPANMEVSDERFDAFHHVDGDILVTPNPTHLKLDGKIVETAPIVYISKDRVGKTEFNRNLDDEPLKVISSDGKGQDANFI